MEAPNRIERTCPGKLGRGSFRSWWTLTHMNVKSELLRQPSDGLSRRRALVGAVGLLVLAAMVLAHADALTVFLWRTAAKPGGVIAITLLWVVSVQLLCSSSCAVHVTRSQHGTVQLAYLALPPSIRVAIRRLVNHASNSFIERKSSGRMRLPAASTHVERWRRNPRGEL